MQAVCHEAALAPEEGGAPECGEDRRVLESYSTFSSTQSSGTVQKSPGISSSSITTKQPPSGTMCHLIFHLPSS